MTFETMTALATSPAEDPGGGGIKFFTRDNPVSEDMNTVLRLNVLKPESSILNTPIGQALKEHFAQYGDIFKSSSSNTEVA